MPLESSREGRAGIRGAQLEVCARTGAAVESDGLVPFLHGTLGSF